MASENVSKTVSLKDYIIDMQSAAVKGSAQYEVVLENNTDFIIKRRTATTDRELVILVSKGLYYIKDCKTGHIEELKEQSLNTFLRELKDGMVALHEVHWLSNLYRESVGLIMQVITDETLTDMCRHNVLVDVYKRQEQGRAPHSAAPAPAPKPPAPATPAQKAPAQQAGFASAFGSVYGSGNGKSGAGDRKMF